MDANTFIGMFVVATATIVGLFFTVGKPILNLNTNIVRLNTTIDNLVKNDTKQDTRIEEHSKILSNHEQRIVLIEHEIENKWI